MTAYFTETTDEKPQVLLITQQGSFPTAFTAEVHKKKMDVVFVDANSFGAPDQSELLRKLDSAYFYKIFWWWGELGEAPQAASQIIEFLLKRIEPVTVGASSLQPFTANQTEFSHWQRIFELQRRNFSYLQQYLPNANLLLTGSLVGEREDFVTRLIYAQLTEPQPIFPATLFSVSTRTEAITKIVPFLFQPAREKLEIFLQGTLIPSSKVLESFQVKNAIPVQVLDVVRQTDFLEEMTVIRLDTPAGEKELLNEVKQWKIEVPVVKPQEPAPQRNQEVAQPAEVFAKVEQVAQAPAKKEAEKKNIPRTPKSDLLKNPLKRKPKAKVPIVPISPPVPPVWYPELDQQLEILIKKQKPRVVAIFPPVIENRLKRYELLVKQKFEQQKLKAYLPKNGAQITVSQDSYEVSVQDKAAHSEKSVKELDSQIVRIFGEQRQAIRQSSQTVTVQQVEKVATKTHRQTKFIFLLGISMSVLIFAGLLSGGFFVNKYLLENSLYSLISNKTYSASEKQNRALRLNAFASAFSLQTDVWQSILGKDRLKYSATLAEVGKEAASSISLDTDILQLSKELWQQTMVANGSSSGNPLPTVVTLAGKTEEAYKKLSLIQAKIQNLEEDGSVDTNKQLVQFNDQIQERRKVLAVSQQFEQMLPFLMGQGARRTYLVVLQNNLELRATGGVVQAAALITFDNGVLTNTQVINVPEIDQKFPGQVAPPADLQSLLGQKKWSMRDANWSANFPTAAQQMTTFVEKSLGKQVDGVIGLNLISLRELIKATGPISLPEYQEVVTDKNVFEKVEFHSELAVVPTANPDYLTVLLNKQLSQLSQLPAEKTPQLIDALYNSLKADQINIWSTDQGVASTLDSVGWSGAVLTPNCPTQFTDDNEKCVVDSVFQVDSNIGINRANFFIDRSIQHQVQVSPAKATHLRLITYKNTAQSNSWPAGAYKNYVRFYLPTKADNFTVAINDEALNPTQIMQFAEGNKKVVGFMIDVPIQQTVTVKFQYDEPVALTAPFAYTFFDQKQSGTEADPVQIDVIPDTNLKPVYIAPQATINDGLIRFSNTQDKHLFVGIKLR